MYIQCMAKSYSVAGARAHLAEILDDVEAGRDVRLTRRNRPVAVVISTERYEMLRGERGQFASAYQEFLGRHAPAELDLSAEFFSSLRDRRPGRRVRL
jgi:prevent-host-death family protein